MLDFRPATDSDTDYEAIARIWCANWPEHPRTAEQYRYSFETRAPSCILEWFIGEDGGRVVATALFKEEKDTTAEGKFLVYIQVDPEEQGRGVGAAVYDLLMERIEHHRPSILGSFTREDHAVAIGFLERRGFAVTMREQDSELDVQSFDASRFADVVEQVRQSGVEILSGSELEARDPEWKRKVWELHEEIVPDVPDDDLLVNGPFEEFVKAFEHPDYLPDGYFVALDEDRYVGVSSVWNRRAKENELYTRLTSVARSHRRLGIATALKVRAIEYAKKWGARAIEADNEENNPMYGLNLKLGFRPTIGWLQFRKELPPEGGD